MLQDIALESLNVNAFDLIPNAWMLIAAGDDKKQNMMVGSWGSMGFLWKRHVINIYVRPQRFTYSFIKEEPYFSINILPESYRSVLKMCGTQSGRNIDKVKESGLTTHVGGLAPYFEESSLVFICKKIYDQGLDPSCFIDPDMDQAFYPKQDYHRNILGEIIQVLSI